jgi:hypothetical protein
MGFIGSSIGFLPLDLDNEVRIGWTVVLVYIVRFLFSLLLE